MMDSFSFLIAAGLFTLFIGFAVGFWSATHYKLNKFADKIKDVSDIGVSWSSDANGCGHSIYATDISWRTTMKSDAILYLKLWFILIGGLLLGVISFLVTFLMKNDLNFSVSVGILTCLCAWTVACLVGWILSKLGDNE
jgi:hypothetical protein